MCGIAGMAGRRDEALAERMAETLAHRGPDAQGVCGAEGMSFGHRRLSVIDLAGGAQPMTAPCGRYTLTYNGEIYNFRALRKELEAEGRAFRTDSDTEVLLHALIAWGEAALPRLQGMFAFGFWDASARRLLLARDPLGVKPLYHAVHEGVLYFASEMKAILAVPGMSREIDFAGADDYFTYLYTVPPRTCFRAIRQLPPGHWAAWENGALRTRRYWRFDPAPLAHAAEEWPELVRGRLSETVGRYLVSDVPLGAFLSGGLDSATILHYMSEHAPEAVNTFTVGFGEEGGLYDESAAAASLAAHYGARHHALRVEGSAAEGLPAVLRHFDEPFGNPTALLTHAICGLVREHVTVVLSGDGGDECFGGYPRYAGAGLMRHYRRLPRWLRARVIDAAARRLPESTRGWHALRRARDFSAGSLLPPEALYASWVSHYAPGERQALYTEETRRAVGGHDSHAFIRDLAAECPGADPVTQAMYIDLHAFLPNNVLQYGDRMSMAHGLETRVPLADPGLAALALRAPAALKVRGLETKRLLRAAMRDRLPDEVLRRKKAGFNPPMGVWLNGRLRPLADDCLAAGTLRRRGLFNPVYVARLLEEHRASRRDHTWRLWALIVFEQWLRDYID